MCNMNWHVTSCTSSNYQTFHGFRESVWEEEEGYPEPSPDLSHRQLLRASAHSRNNRLRVSAARATSMALPSRKVEEQPKEPRSVNRHGVLASRVVVMETASGRGLLPAVCRADLGCRFIFAATHQLPHDYRRDGSRTPGLCET